MHIWQAIKMAGKSLLTNKLRSFLTMLGIIIGVVTVSLLVTVAQGVSNAIVSSIRSQSTLAIVMNTSGKMNYSTLSSVLKSEQGDESADDYFKYSLVYSSNSIVAGDLTGFNSEDEDVKSYIWYKKLYTLDENNQIVTDVNKLKSFPMTSSIYAVDKNFNEVYDLDIDGKFPTTSDEIIVDKEFIDSYFTSKSNDEVKGSKVTFGVQYYTQIKIKFKNEVSTDDIEKICYFIGNYSVDVENSDLSNIQRLNFSIIRNEDNSLYLYDENNFELTINIEPVRTFANEVILSKLINNNIIADNTNGNEAVSVDDIYDISKTKTYTIVGIINESTSLFGGGSSLNTESNKQNDNPTILDLLTTSKSGTCYMLLDGSNLAPLGSDKLSVSELNINYAYLRYKTEDVMAESVNNITLALVGATYGFMTDFMVISMSSVASIINDVMGILTTMLTVISIVSLIVGGIGIMNIMLVAVSERTREIGIRKAIGAKRSSILVQFLIEALMLSLIGGIIGLGISAIGVAIIAHYIGFAMSIPLWVVGMSIGFCTFIGLLFGMFPAVKASRMQPIDALRRE